MHHGMKKGAPSCVKVPYQGETGNGTKNAPKTMTGNRMVASLRDSRCIWELSKPLLASVGASRLLCLGGVRGGPWMRLTYPGIIWTCLRSKVEQERY